MTPSATTTAARAADRPAAAGADGRVRVLRVIARMNVGGPSHHVSLLSGRLDPERFETLLVHGRLGAEEGSLEQLAGREACRVQQLPELAPEINPRDDIRAVRALVGIIRDFRPHVVHTHTAKAGFVARIAASLVPGPRPVVVHTYHGHVLERVFGRAKSGVFRVLEHGLARRSDVLIGVSSATVDDLVRLGVARRERFRVVPLGLDLERFQQPDPAARGAFRAAAGARDGDVLLAYMGRLVPHKRVDVLIDAVARLRGSGLPVKLAIVGGGPERDALQTLAAERGVADDVHFHGYVADVVPVAHGADIAVIASRSEGTPVCIIEAAAAGRPAVAASTDGVPDIVRPETGMLVPPGDAIAFADAVQRLVEDKGLRERMGRSAREHVLPRYSVDRLLGDIERLYDELVAAAPQQAGRRATPSPGPQVTPSPLR